MAPQPRRTRKTALKSKSSNRSPPPPPESRATSEDDGSDTSSVTRCVCGEQHNLGLMVQCDQCEVWQHCECVGLTEEALPDHYYCDECQPENHAALKIHGRLKRAYRPKDNSDPVEEVPADVPEPVSHGNDARATKRRKRAQGEITRSPRPTTSQGPGTSSRPRRTSPAVEPVPPQSRSTSPEHQAQVPWPKEDDVRSLQLGGASDSDDRSTPRLTAKLETPPNTRRKKAPGTATRRQGHSIGHPSSHANTTLSGRCSAGNHSKTNPKQMSHHHHPHSSPQPAEDYCYDIPYWNEESGRPSREASPPARVKLPHSKMSLTDMNRRAQQILDYIGKLQVELADRDPPPPVETPPHCRQRSLSISSTSSSLSSASTLPLLDEEVCAAEPSPLSDATSPTTPVPNGHGRPEDESTVAIMDRVTRDLIKFQRKFGVFPQQTNRMPGKLMPIKR